MPAYRFISSMKVPLDSRVEVTIYSVGRARRTGITHHTMKVIVDPLNGCKMKRFVGQIRKLTLERCVRPLIPYWNDIPDYTKMSPAANGVTVNRPCVTSVPNDDALIIGQTASRRTLKTKKMLEGFLELRGKEKESFKDEN